MPAKLRIGSIQVSTADLITQKLYARITDSCSRYWRPNVLFLSITFYQEYVLTSEEMESICGEGTSYRQNEHLLSVLTRKTMDQFDRFLDALKTTGQTHVRNHILTGQKWSQGLWLSCSLLDYTLDASRSHRRYGDARHTPIQPWSWTLGILEGWWGRIFLRCLHCIH